MEKITRLVSIFSFAALWGFSSGCAHVPAGAETDYYRMVETRVGMASKGETEKEVKETFCPSSVLGGQDPQYWSFDEWAKKFKSNECLQLSCRYRGGLKYKCFSRGNEKLSSDMERERKKLLGQG